jgi:DNA-binding transcriptional MocR family regulator
MPLCVSSEAVFEQVLRDGIRVMPGAMFSNSNRFNHYLRLNCGNLRTPELERALDTVAAAVRRLAG